jgi:hypothetical protein
VPDRRTKRRAEECVESVYGARDVMNELRVQREESASSQTRLGSQGSQPSQGSQATQAGRGSTASQPQGQTAPRPGSGTSPSDQPAKH